MIGKNDLSALENGPGQVRVTSRFAELEKIKSNEGSQIVFEQSVSCLGQTGSRLVLLLTETVVICY